MIYAVLLNYTRPMEEVNHHLEPHKAWLVNNLRQGGMIFAGPLDSKTGGMILASCPNREALEAMMAQDPFIAQNVASYQAHACSPALASAEFPAHWAPGARFI
ncbi:MULTISPECIES: YciI family protein [unclassified Herbaspirillum]|uniref:YciI family protein n=1 Tax=unclassified Herbaspirillum TaxID=2624150 RepID=UPI001150B8B7|nr:MULTISPECIES: YciI family protein [unclassified Herbaspirillum]MBB5393775.1 uncharacterized protein YciI [Herbaspirillum sp. SJZ102]TQK01365.1 uncharacterized protein YciI [Herbaspirillum sp. SJZ130]TQK05761.1 uncharacterized protein YciI [Herbaspirillum sp. SJZ106]TWC65133.1 uncharacterized protein YciI [Herbaspirillum sp. SJZ099]